MYINHSPSHSGLGAMFTVEPHTANIKGDAYEQDKGRCQSTVSH